MCLAKGMYFLVIWRSPRHRNLSLPTRGPKMLNMILLPVCVIHDNCGIIVVLNTYMYHVMFEYDLCAFGVTESAYTGKIHNKYYF